MVYIMWQKLYSNIGKGILETSYLTGFTFWMSINVWLLSY